MALQRMLSSKLCSKFFRPVVFTKNYLKGTRPINKATSVEFDALDNFTTELLQKRINALEIKSGMRNVRRSPPPETCYDVDINSLSKVQLREMISHALQQCNDSAVIKLIQECLKNNICPNREIILQVLYICAQKSEIGLINGIKQLCITNEIHFPPYFDFLLYEAHAIWMRGNVIKALDIFETLYINNPFLRRHIKMSLKNLIIEGTKSNSEAILLHIVKFSKNIVEKYRDYHPMLCVWEVCFLSEWFSDQQIALELLYNNRKLGDALINRLPYILYTSLRNHRTEVIYRLLEIMLDFQMKEQYLIVVMALLDYQFLQGNLRGYSEVIKWCEYNDLALPSLYNGKFLELLLGKQERRSSYRSCHNNKSDYNLSF